MPDNLSHSAEELTDARRSVGQLGSSLAELLTSEVPRAQDAHERADLLKARRDAYNGRAVQFTRAEQQFLHASTRETYNLYREALSALESRQARFCDDIGRGLQADLAALAARARHPALLHAIGVTNRRLVSKMLDNQAFDGVTRTARTAYKYLTRASMKTSPFSTFGVQGTLVVDNSTAAVRLLADAERFQPCIPRLPERYLPLPVPVEDPDRPPLRLNGTLVELDGSFCIVEPREMSLGLRAPHKYSSVLRELVRAGASARGHEPAIRRMIEQLQASGFLEGEVTRIPVRAWWERPEVGAHLDPALQEEVRLLRVASGVRPVPRHFGADSKSHVPESPPATIEAGKGPASALVSEQPCVALPAYAHGNYDVWHAHAQTLQDLLPLVELTGPGRWMQAALRDWKGRSGGSTTLTQLWLDMRAEIAAKSHVGGAFERILTRQPLDSLPLIDQLANVGGELSLQKRVVADLAALAKMSSQKGTAGQFLTLSPDEVRTVLSRIEPVYQRRAIECHVQVRSGSEGSTRAVLNGVYVGFGSQAARLSYVTNNQIESVGTSGEAPDVLDVAPPSHHLSGFAVAQPSGRHRLTVVGDTLLPLGAELPASRLSVRYDEALGRYTVIDSTRQQPVIPASTSRVALELLPPFLRLAAVLGGQYPGFAPWWTLRSLGRTHLEPDILLLPEIRVGARLIVRRRAHLVGRTTLDKLLGGSAAGQFEELAAFRRRLGLPRFCVYRMLAAVSHTGFPRKERKPLVLDFASPLSVSVFAAETARAPGDVLLEDSDPDLGQYGRGDYVAEVALEVP